MILPIPCFGLPIDTHPSPDECQTLRNLPTKMAQIEIYSDEKHLSRQVPNKSKNPWTLWIIFWKQSHPSKNNCEKIIQSHPSRRWRLWFVLQDWLLPISRWKGLVGSGTWRWRWRRAPGCLGYIGHEINHYNFINHYKGSPRKTLRKKIKKSMGCERITSFFFKIAFFELTSFRVACVWYRDSYLWKTRDAHHQITSLPSPRNQLPGDDEPKRWHEWNMGHARLSRFFENVMKTTTKSRWCFQICLIFALTWGDDPIELKFFKWVETLKPNHHLGNLFWFTLSNHLFFSKSKLGICWCLLAAYFAHKDSLDNELLGYIFEVMRFLPSYIKICWLNRLNGCSQISLSWPTGNLTHEEKSGFGRVSYITGRFFGRISTPSTGSGKQLVE